jgi:hypothetical protein
MINLKKLKPIGAVLILLCAAVAVIMCFTVDLGVPDRYESAHDTVYYQTSPETMTELKNELTANVFPELNGIVSCVLNPDTGRLDITVDSAHYETVLAVITRDFDPSLFEFIKAEE